MVFRNGLNPTERSRFVFRRVGCFEDLDSEREVVTRRGRLKVARRVGGLLGIDDFARRQSVLVFRNGLNPTERSRFVFRRVGCFEDLDSEREVVTRRGRLKVARRVGGLPGSDIFALAVLYDGGQFTLFAIVGTSVPWCRKSNLFKFGRSPKSSWLSLGSMIGPGGSVWCPPNSWRRLTAPVQSFLGQKTFATLSASPGVVLSAERKGGSPLPVVGFPGLAARSPSKVQVVSILSFSRSN